MGCTTTQKAREAYKKGFEEGYNFGTNNQELDEADLDSCYLTLNAVRQQLQNCETELNALQNPK